MPPTGPTAGNIGSRILASALAARNGGVMQLPPASNPGVISGGRVGVAPPAYGPGGAFAPASRGKMPNAPGSTASFGGTATATSSPTGGTAGFKGGGMSDGAGGGGGTQPGARQPAGRPQPQPAAGERTYGGYTVAQLMANPALEARLGPHAAALWAADKGKYAKPTTPPPAGTTPPPATTGAPAPSPADPAPAPPTGPPGTPGAPPPATDPSGNAPQPYAFDDPFNQILSMLPLMDLNAKKQVSGAMADAGFTGNRYGSAAMRKAGEIGAENSLAQNAMMSQVLGDYANRAQDRSLAATGQATNLGALLDAIRRGQVDTLSGLGQYETGRQDAFSNVAFNDWSQNRLGYLPLLLQAAMSRHAGSPGSTIAIPQPGKPSTIDQVSPWISLLAGLF